MKKRIFSILLCLCMVLSFFPTTVLTASGSSETDSIIVGVVTLNSSTPYLANGASTASADKPTSGGYAFFDAANGTLTLHNATIEDDAWPLRTSYGIYFLGDLSIVLEGTNTIKGDGVAGSYDSYGIYCSGDVTISGDSATIEGGIVAGTIPISCGIYSEGNIKIISGSVTVKADSYAMNKAPITPDTGYTVRTATYPTDTPTDDYQPDKIAEYGTVRVSPTSVVVGGVTLDDSTPYLANGASSANTDKPISGGYAQFDARTCVLTLHDAVINGAASDIDNYGIYAFDDLTIALEGSNRITADDATFDNFFSGDSKSIFVDGAALTVSGSGSLTVNSGEGASSYGIYAQGVTIKNGATVQATAGNSDASSTGGARYSCGIYSGLEACSIYGGANVTATGGATESKYAESMGIHAWRMTINNSDVTAKGNTKAMNLAPTVTGGTITAATDVSGNDIVAYVSANMGTYKYIRVAPGEAQAQWSVAGNDGSAPTSWIQGDFSEAVEYTNSLTGQTAYIQLLSDVNDAFLYVENGKAAILDLNGKTLDRGLSGKSAVAEGCVIAVNGGTLTLKDSGIGGKITGGNSTYGTGGGVTVRWGGVFNMEGGIITGNHAAYGGGVFVAQNSLDGRDSLFYMSGGSITGNDSSVYGGGVRIAEYSAMTVSGAAIIQDNFKGGTLSGGVYVQGIGEKSNAVLNGKAITVSGPLTGSIGVVKEEDYLYGKDAIQIAVSDASYTITQSDATRFTSDSGDCITAYSNADSNPVVLLKLTYTVTYDANGATSGSVPADTPSYGSGDTVTVAANSGNLQKTCHTFVGWNTKADGTGISYTTGSGTFHISDNTILYAEWAEAHRGGTATCTEKAVCSVCGVKYGELDASNHKGTTYLKDQKEATCYEEGYTGDTYCSDCNAKIKDGKPVAKNAHNPASVWTTDETDHWKECQTVGCGNIIDKAPHSGGETTCVTKAVCSVCGVKYGEVNVSNHKHTEVRNAKDATCCEAGYTGDTWCTDCNTKIATGTTIAATDNHVDVDGDWESDGTNHYHTCSFGTKFDVTAHSDGEATCKKQAECSVCGHSYGELNLTNHKGTTYMKAQKEATCYEEGYTGDTWCLDCNQMIAKGKDIDKLEHKLVLVKSQEATAAKEGNIKYYYCENCGKYYSDEAGSKEIAKEVTVITKLAPKIIDGNNAKIDKTSKEPVSFRSNAAFADFIRVELDGKELVKDKDYTLKEGSIIATLTPEFSANLSTGEHTLGIVSASGTAIASFTVTADNTFSDNSTDNNSEKLPQTGDNSNIILWSFAAVISLAALCTTAIVSKKKKVR